MLSFVSSFERAFENLIEKKTDSNSAKLYYLIQYTRGDVQELMRSCLVMNTDEGYARARELLKARYGQPFKIATAYIDNVLKTPLIKAEDARALQRYSVLLASCENTLTKIGYASKIDNPDTLRKIIEKLPFSLRDRWRATADDSNEVKRRDVTT
ncbi:hypothetical protein QZH41_001403 [Actinostola sp. cb2023]|nr:hypothetical protein QZH41_001403 [Actinostola sp. cb2023]